MSAVLTDETLFALRTAIGHIVMNWVYVERMIDLSITKIYHTTAGRDIEPELPRAIKRKIKYLKCAFRTIPDLDALAKGFRPLLSDAQTLANIRHVVAHGAVLDFDAKTETVTFNMLDAKGHFHTERPEKLSYQELLKAGRECANLAEKLGPLVTQLVATEMPLHTGNNFLRRWCCKLVRIFPFGK